MSKAVLDYSERETLNRTTQFALKDFAASFSAVQDYRETEVSCNLFVPAISLQTCISCIV